MRTNGEIGTLRLADLYAPIQADLGATQRVLADELICDQPFISDLCQHVRQFHGKLLRPALLLLTARAIGDVRPSHHVLGAVVELVHISTLVHDDVLDGSDIRRRAATVNRLWGNERAVLMGDFLYSHAFHLCSSLDSQYASRVIGQTAVTVCEGEMMQVASRGNLELTEAEYLDIITRKTASLVEACCHLGAVYAEADEDWVRRLRTFGNAIGVAFQIVDDLLDLTGDEAEVGKSLGRDVHQGEVTLPVIHYLREVGPTDRAAMLDLLQSDGATAQREIGARLHAAGSIAYAQAAAGEQIELAQQALEVLPPSPARNSLSAMAGFVLARRQ
ncbi:MAG: polyprenyl synthetase family protein [Phycisphaerales bacterium]|nr:polyprenyl synthetase family protein [Phycisphaerales bacterium]